VKRNEAEALRAALSRGTSEHYVDAALYDHEYHRRREDVRWYRTLADEIGGPILELGCGSGRLLLPLARDGHAVVGVDRSAPMLKRLRDRLVNAGGPVRERVSLRKADFRALSLGRRFPLVVCPFNAFMHLYTRRDVERFLAGVRAHLEPNGCFAFDVMNPDLAWLTRDSEKRWARTRFRHPRTGQRMVYTTNLIYDGALQIAFMRIYYQPEKGGRERVVHLTHRYFYPLELEALLHYNGFRIERFDGDFEGEPPATESESLVVRCALR
jgi:SAM-dependent methyltransferase